MKVIKSAGLLIAGAVVAVVTMLAGAPATALPIGHAAVTSRATCPAGYVCSTDPVDFIDQSQTADPQFVVSDPSNAPQFSVGTGGAASWANPLCITNNPLTDPPLRFVACIGGPWSNGQGRPLVTLYGPKGKAYSLTIADIAWINAQRAIAARRNK